MITDVPGVRVGHWTDEAAATGCTVVLLPAGTVASGEVRGGAPGTREFALLAPERLVPGCHAVVLSGGSAFGLAACDGVMAWCEQRGIGFPTPAGPVPIVVGMVLFDLMVGDPSVRPGPAAGSAACEAAVDGAFAVGAVGAGTGARVGAWRGAGAVRPGGLGTATERDGALTVSALFAVNAFGDLADTASALPPPSAPSGFGTNTTVGVIATNALLDKVGCLLVAQGGHDGLARALEPAHASVDGDAVVAAAVGGIDAPVDLVRVLAARATERAIRSALT
ncbi:MAG TPA: P1 family peptidase [Acidimicrobiales bacterium]|nr:P1 family peptidase [Acidimicrobiales bacterium]